MSDQKPSNPKDAIGIKKLPLHLVSGVVKAYQSIAHFLGATKYGSWNYRGVGVRASVYVSALHRHVDKWWEGEEYDQTDGTPHLANALACINILIEAKYCNKLEDDRPPSRDLNPLYKELEAIMERIKAQYPDANPKHYTIADKDEDIVSLQKEEAPLATVTPLRRRSYEELFQERQRAMDMPYGTDDVVVKDGTDG